MYSKRNEYSKKSTPPTQEELYTSPKQKTPELAVFYNIAFFRVAGIVNHLLGNSYEQDKNRLENVYINWLGVAGTADDTLPEAAYSRLRNYLWKGYLLEKNSSGYELTQDDRQLVREMLHLLYNVRNFHSHAWHDNKALVYSPELSAFIEELHGIASSAQSKEMPEQTKRYLDEHKDSRGDGQWSSFFYKASDTEHYLTPDGRTFILSFFLTRGEMARFLQQRKGSKRNDKPEFKIKHLVYRYFTHRDGASRNFYSYEEPLLNTLPENERREVLAMRQAFKVISYLNDVPQQSNDTELFPLWKTDGTTVTDIQGLIDFCMERELLKELVMTPLVREKTETKSHKAKDGSKRKKVIVKMEHVAELTGTRWEGWKFQISQNTLHRAILDAIRTGDMGNLLYDKLDLFVKERIRLLDIVEHPEIIEAEPEEFKLNAELDEYYRYRLRSGDKLKKRMGVWLDNWDKPQARNYASSIRNFKQAIREEPIEVSYHDLWFQEKRKPRRADRFTEFSVHYLMDMGLTPQWEWQFERFEGEMVTKTELHYGAEREVEKNVLKRKKVFSASPLEGHRLSLTPDHQALMRLKGNPDHLFLIGHRALKNLLAAKHKGKDISALLPTIADELNKLTSGKATLKELSVLEPQYIRPGMLVNLGHNHPKRSAENLVKRGRERIEGSIIPELQTYADAKLDDEGRFVQSIGLSRAAKNRQVMRCYTYFDWKYDEKSEFKFLRQDEYQRMSVFHYSLEHTYNNGNNRFEKDRRFGFLLKDIMAHMPDEVKGLIKGSCHLDQLLQRTAQATIKLLQHWANEMESCDAATRELRLSRIGISGAPTPIEKNRHVPFDIHPGLIKRALFKKGELRDMSLSATVRKNPTLSAGLVESHYDHGHLSMIFGPPRANGLPHRSARKAIGKLDEIHTEDILLWAAAREYLEKMNPAVRDLVNKRLMHQSSNTLTVTDLRDVEIPMEVELEGHGRVVVELKLHQLDDFLLVESRPRIARAVWHVLERYTSPEAKELVGIHKQDGKMHVPYEEAFREIQRVYNHSLHWARPLLKWEQGVIADMTTEGKARLGAEKRAKGRMAYISFSEVVAYVAPDAALADRLRQIRNTAFHAELPHGWTYADVENDTAICNLIGYEKREKQDYRSEATIGT